MMSRLAQYQQADAKDLALWKARAAAMAAGETGEAQQAELVLRHLSLAQAFAFRFGRGVAARVGREDLLQSARAGLVLAAETWSPADEPSFAVWAMAIMRKEIHAAIAASAALSAPAYWASPAIRKLAAAMVKAGEDPSLVKTGDALRAAANRHGVALSRWDIPSALQAHFNSRDFLLSSDAPLTSERRAVLAAADTPEADPFEHEREAFELVLAWMEKQGSGGGRLANLLRRQRAGRADGAAMTLDDLAREDGVSRQRMGQLSLKALGLAKAGRAALGLCLALAVLPLTAEAQVRCFTQPAAGGATTVRCDDGTRAWVARSGNRWTVQAGRSRSRDWMERELSAKERARGKRTADSVLAANPPAPSPFIERGPDGQLRPRAVPDSIRRRIPPPL